MSPIYKRTLDPLRVTALIYVRKSFIHRGQETVSPERQLAACRAYCQQQGWKPEIYQDADEGVHYSGRTIDHRPAWQQVLKRLDDPDVAAVVVNTIDRASRSIKDFYEFFDNCDKSGVTFVATAQQIDSSTAAGKLMLAITVTFAAFEADVASDRVSATIAHKKAQGVHWGYTPFGCGRLPGGVLIPNDDIRTVQKALELYADGGSYESVAQALNVLGLRFRNRQGEHTPFGEHHIRTMVCLAPVYAGHLVEGRGKDLDPDAPMRKAAHAPMISEDLLGRVLFSHRTKRLHTKRSAYTYALTPLLYCAHCGQPLRGSNSNDRYTYKHTKRCFAGNIRSYDVSALEDHVVALLGELTIPDQLLAEIRAETMQRSARSAESDRVGEQIREVQTKLKKLLELYLEDELDKETYREQKAQLDLQAQQLERMRNAGVEDTEDILLRMSSIGSIISRGTPAQQKDALRALFERIDVDSEGKIVRLAPRAWAKPLFGCLAKENPAVVAGSISSRVHDMPPRGFVFCASITC